MRSTRNLLFGIGTICLAMLAAGAAWAGHGKIGLWKITTKIDMGGMPQLSPEQMAKMRSMGIKVPMNNTFITEHCMTAQEVAMSRPPEMGRHGKQECKMQNMKVVGQSVSADMVCSGEAHGSGHFALSYDTPEHYSGRMSMNISVHGHAMASSTSFEGRWISASCKAGH